MPCIMTSSVPRDTIGWKKSSLLVQDDKKSKMCGKALGVGWWMESLGELPYPLNYSTHWHCTTILGTVLCILYTGTMCGKAESVSWWKKSLGKSQDQNPRGRRPRGFWPRDFIHYDTPKAFPHIFILLSSRTSKEGFLALPPNPTCP